MMNTPIRISTQVYADMDIVWEAYNDPQHVKKWHKASDAWICPHSQSIFREWGGFTHTMELRDGDVHVDFEWTYTEIVERELIAYSLNDERQVQVRFNNEESFAQVIIDFEADSKNDPKAQEQLWKAILDSFARYAESL